MLNAIDQCRWPELPERTDAALCDAVSYILDRFDVHGIIAAGTHIIGQPDSSSDLDIYVVHVHPQRQRIQKRFNGLATEIFVNPPVAIRRYFEQEIRRPLTAHMLATGFVVLDSAAIVEELRAEAIEWLNRPLELSESELTWLQYAAVDAYENAQDLSEKDPAGAVRVLHDAVSQMLDTTFLENGKKLPRTKTYLDELSTLDSDLGRLAREYYTAHNVEEQFELAALLAARTFGETGFFEWESQLEPII